MPDHGRTRPLLGCNSGAPKSASHLSQMASLRMHEPRFSCVSTVISQVLSLHQPSLIKFRATDINHPYRD